MNAIDIKLNKIKSEGTAYYRLDKDFKKFLERCEEKHGIIGFEYKKGSFNFGIILGKKLIK